MTRNQTRFVALLAMVLGLMAALVVPAFAGGEPIARPDKVVVKAGSVKQVNVLANDRVARKGKAWVQVGSKPRGFNVKQVGSRLKIRVLPAVSAGKYRVKYVVVDHQGRKAHSFVKVRVKAAPPAPVASNRLSARINALAVTPERRDGYDRALFKHWVDADRNGCDARREVLIAEATKAPSIATKCALSGGTWYSSYDGVTITNSSAGSEFDIDHMVPLAEAWDSGAHAWTSARREAFANDLSDERSLVAVTASSNRSKSDRDPAQWMPTLERCRYITEWVAVKIRWTLSIDDAERSTLRTFVQPCNDPVIQVALAS